MLLRFGAGGGTCLQRSGPDWFEINWINFDSISGDGQDADRGWFTTVVAVVVDAVVVAATCLIESTWIDLVTFKIPYNQFPTTVVAVVVAVVVATTWSITPIFNWINWINWIKFINFIIFKIPYNQLSTTVVAVVAGVVQITLQK